MDTFKLCRAKVHPNFLTLRGGREGALPFHNAHYATLSANILIYQIVAPRYHPLVRPLWPFAVLFPPLLW